MIDFLIGPFKRINLGKYRVGAKHTIKHHVDIVATKRKPQINVSSLKHETEKSKD